MEQDYISADIEHVEQYLGELFRVPVAVCIADTEDIVNGALGDDLPDLRREPDPGCVRAFQYIARIEWAPSNDAAAWRLTCALYRRECDAGDRHARPVDEVARRPLTDMPSGVQRHAHPYLAQLAAAAGGEWQMLRALLVMTRRTAGIRPPRSERGTAAPSRV